ncbi:MAG TPA: glycosyltransferase [Candidatus Dormibacteraeota bacterium]|nr:glycosyltransferase [Candidatus Dormibacteraeota bacterium]
MRHLAVDSLFLLTGMPAALCSLWLLVLAAASGWHRPAPPPAEPRRRLLVLVPAHDEEEMIGSCVTSLMAQDYPPDLRRVVVVADNCTDGTAAAAAGAGAEVWVRDQPGLRGKGPALRWAFDRLPDLDPAPDAVVVVDADSVADRAFLRELEAVFSRGHPVVQADDVLAERPGDRRALLEAAALLLRNRVRLSGRAALGLPALLCGNGMLIARSVLARHPWTAYSIAEDAEYSLILLAAGVPIGFARRATVLAQPTPGVRGMYTQSLRWDGGRLQLARRWTLRLIRLALVGRDPLLLATACELAMPPLSALATASLTGSGVAIALVAAGLIPPWAAASWAGALLILPLYLVVGLRSGGAPLRVAVAFLLAPWFLARKLRVYWHLLSGRAGGHWIRTQRPSEAGLER